MSEENKSVGSGISTTKMKKTNSVNDHLARYVFSPMLKIVLDDRNITGAMSQINVQKGRITNFVDTPYKIRDESSDTLLSEASDSEFYGAPLTEHIHTARHQAEYLESIYGIKGLTVLEDLTGLDPFDVVEIEEAILPDYFETILELGKYLTDKDAIKANINKSAIDANKKKIARKLIEPLKSGVNDAMKFATDWLAEAKAEIIHARTGKLGKSSHDPFDMEMYRQTGLPPLREKDVDYADAATKAEASGNKELADAILKLATSTQSGNGDAVQAAKVEALEAQLAEMRELMLSLKDPVTTVVEVK